MTLGRVIINKEALIYLEVVMCLPLEAHCISPPGRGKLLVELMVLQFHSPGLTLLDPLS